MTTERADGYRVVDLLDRKVFGKGTDNLKIKNFIIRRYYNDEASGDGFLKQYEGYRKF
jgi:hypothetical protein